MTWRYLDVPFFDNQGVKIYYEIEGSGPELIMIHGFAASIEANWRMPGWVDALKNENRLVLMDCRGHGQSDKPKDPDQYGKKMEEDIIGLMDHLSMDNANFFGYSMGSRLSLSLLLRVPERFKSVILGGFVLPPPDDEEATRRSRAVVEAFKAESIEQVKNPVGREFRRFAESTGADLDALAGVMMGSNQSTSGPVTEENLKKIKVPLMSVVGSDDFLKGDVAAFAKYVPNACHFQIQGRDHLSVVGDSKFHMVVRAFLNHVNK
jgi:pimeloyl-ACP methyl ester carboxylesterase